MIITIYKKFELWLLLFLLSSKSGFKLDTHAFKWVSELEIIKKMIVDIIAVKKNKKEKCWVQAISIQFTSY